MVIDAHQHFWRISRGDYGWMEAPDAAPLRQDRLPEDLERMAAKGGVDGTIVVQAAPTVDETLFLLGLSDQAPIIRGVVGWIDLEADVESQLARIAHPKLCGIRPMLQDIEDTGWLSRPSVSTGLARAIFRCSNPSPATSPACPSSSIIAPSPSLTAPIPATTGAEG